MLTYLNSREFLQEVLHQTGQPYHHRGLDGQNNQKPEKWMLRVFLAVCLTRLLAM